MKITKIETCIPADISPGLMYCRIHTDEGITGYGESFQIPEAIAAVIHHFMAPRLLGNDALNIEGHWRFLYERMTNFGSRGAEIRGLSAIDLALWDIKGKATGMPVWQLLGGKVQDRVRVYNSSGGPGYGGKIPKNTGFWPGYGKVGEKGPLNDYWSAVHEPEAYAKNLLSEGIKATKLWTLDFAAHKAGGPLYVDFADIKEGLKPFFKIREAVGDQLELILDGHGFFQLPMALRIADAMKEIKPLWLEDVIRPDCVDTIRDFRDQCGLPIAVSEMLNSAEDYRLVLAKKAADYIMIDPTWMGGISQTMKVTDFAQSHNVPVVMHDCTGPLTLMAGVHVGIARGNVAWQETLRAHMRLRYPEMVANMVEVKDGYIDAPTAPGLGIDLHDDKLFIDDFKLQVSAL
ncbi:MAG: mandelate racemase/muconate lactonizing enzyme family protein [Chthoniobacterales bacterium]